MYLTFMFLEDIEFGVHFRLLLVTLAEFRGGQAHVPYFSGREVFKFSYVGGTPNGIFKIRG
jgi:hypothetical protein